MNEKVKGYPKTDKFEVVDTVGVPHPFCVGSKHVVHASDHFCGRLSEECIKDLEKKLGRPSCSIPGCNLPYEKHEQALLVKCMTHEEEPLREYLRSIVDQCTNDGFAGFAFLDGTKDVTQPTL